MTDLTSFYKTDLVDDHTAADVNNLISAALRSEYKNVETLSADRVLLDADTPIQRFECGAADRVVIAPVADSVNNHPYWIINASAAVKTLTVKNNAETSTIVTLRKNEAGLIIPDGNGSYLSGVSTDQNGWISALETWTRTGNHTFTVSGDVTITYRKGTKVRYKDGGGYEYGVIVSSSYSSPNTTVTLIANSDYAMAAATITDNYLSYIENPEGFPDWFNFAGTAGATGSMTYTSVTVGISRWRVSGRTITYVIFLTGTTGGTASTTLTYTIPVAPSVTAVVFTGGATVDGGATLTAICWATTTPLINVRKPDSSNYGLGTTRVMATTISMEMA